MKQFFNRINLCSRMGTFRKMTISPLLGYSLNSLSYLLSLEETRRDAPNHLGETPLMQAVRNGADRAVITLLIENNCDVSIADNEGLTPLHVAARRRDGDRTVGLLVEGGGDVDARDSGGSTPLHEAVSYGNYDTVCALLYHDASVNETCARSGSTTLHFAVRSGNAEMAELLLDYMDDFSVEDDAGETAFAVALKNKMEVAAGIVERGGDVYEADDNGLPLIFSGLGSSDRDLFGKLWAKLDATALFVRYSTEAFLPYFLRDEEHFSPGERLDILKKVFEGDNFFYDYHERKIYELVYDLCRSDDERLEWTWILLSRDVSVASLDVGYLYESYGFCPEMIAIFTSEATIQDNISYPFVQHIIYNQSAIILEGDCIPQVFTTPFEDEYFADNIDGFVPSLLQKTRDVCREIIYKKYLTQSNFMAYNVIMGLELPGLLKDVLLLKRPIYE